MRSYLFDELLESEIDAVRDYLNQHAVPSGIKDLYWIPLEADLWNEGQMQALSQGSPSLAHGYRLAVELGDDWVKFELLVRTEGVLNVGGGPADERQALFLFRWANEMATQLGLASCLPG